MNAPSLRSTLFVFAVALAGLVLGCTQGPAMPDDLPPLTPCTLTLELDQAPLSDATITLIPASGNWIGVGLTDSAGQATVQTQGRYAGIPAGEYVVTVTKWEESAEAAPDPTSAEADAAAFQGGARPTKRKSLVPAKYTKQETTDLKLSVTHQAIDKTFTLEK